MAGTPERNDGFRRLLLQAPVYRAAQWGIGAHKAYRRLAGERIRSNAASVVVDIGCGTADIARYIDFASYTGFDPNEPYVLKARRQLSDSTKGRATVVHAGVGDPSLSDHLPKRADIAIAVGVLHHLDDQLADGALALAAQLVGSTGRFVSFDPGIVEGQSRIARALVTRDRGQHVRDVETTEELLKRRFRKVSISVDYHFLRVPYTHIVAEAADPR